MYYNVIFVAYRRKSTTIVILELETMSLEKLNRKPYNWPNWQMTLIFCGLVSNAAAVSVFKKIVYFSVTPN